MILKYPVGSLLIIDNRVLEQFRSKKRLTKNYVFDGKRSKSQVFLSENVSMLISLNVLIGGHIAD